MKKESISLQKLIDRYNKAKIKKGNTEINLQLANNNWFELTYTRICACNPIKKIIFLGKNLNPELMDNPEKMISDILIHECIHQVLFDMFKDEGRHEAFTISQLFDTISHYFYDKKEMYKFFNLSDRIPHGKITSLNNYEAKIKILGIKNWLINNSIDINIVNQAFIIANKRLKNEMCLMDEEVDAE